MFRIKTRNKISQKKISSFVGPSSSELFPSILTGPNYKTDFSSSRHPSSSEEAKNI